MGETAIIDKKALRDECLRARERIRPDAAKTAAAELASHVLRAARSEGIVAGYRPVRGEIDVFEAMAQLSERGHELCLPVVEAPKTPLIFRRWRLGQKLVTGRYGIEVPPESEPVLVPGIVLVPLAAFDKKGHRLGYGGGSYDATIVQLRKAAENVQIIGVAFASQQVDAIPAEPHDQRLDAVATERGIIECG